MSTSVENGNDGTATVIRGILFNIGSSLRILLGHEALDRILLNGLCQSTHDTFSKKEKGIRVEIDARLTHSFIFCPLCFTPRFGRKRHPKQSKITFSVSLFYSSSFLIPQQLPFLLRLAGCVLS